MSIPFDALSLPKSATATAPSLTHPKYRPDIDGLRAIAVLMVVGFHAFPNWLPGGFIGVDIFFVISGYLISTILLENLANERFSFGEFYVRRIRRIFPALLVVLSCTLAFGWVVLLPDEFQTLGKHVIGGASFVSNLVLWQESGYFDLAAEFKPLLHLWSLGIEEQFYILWPVVLWLCYKYKFNVLLITVVVALCSFALNLSLVNTDPVAAFYAPHTRFWEILAGSFTAWLMLHPPAWLKHKRWQEGQLPSVAGFGLLLAAFYFINRDKVFPGWWAILPTAGAMLLIWAGPAGIFNRKILANRLLVWIGLISFPLYLWHWPLLVFARIVEGNVPKPEIRLAAFGAAVALAWLTYRFIEKPVRTGSGRLRATRSLVVAMTAALAVGVVVFSGIPAPRNNDAALEPMLAAAVDWDYPGALKASKFMGHQHYRSGDTDDITFMFGDSHVEQYGPRLQKVAGQKSSAPLADAPPALNSVVFGTSGGCPPVPYFQEKQHLIERCREFREASMKFIAQPNVKAVAVGACWNCYFLEDTPENNATSGAYKRRDHSEQAIAEMKKLLQSLKAQKKVYLLLDNPMGKPFDPKSYMNGNRISGVNVGAKIVKEAAPDPEMVRLNHRLVRMAAEIGVEVIDPLAEMCADGTCDVVTGDNQFIYRDDNHLRPFYVLEKAQFIDRVLVGVNKS